jgi:hypothetical protein
MRLLKSATYFIDWLIALAASASAVTWCVYGWVEPVPLAFEKPVLFSRWFVIVLVAALVVLALNVILLWEKITGLFGVDYLRLESSKGEISVSVRALQDALERAVRGISEVTGVRVKVCPTGQRAKSVVIKAYVSLRGSVVYHNISRAIVSVLETTFNDIVSDGVDVKCQVFWEKIRQERSTAPASREPAESLRPRFPVEEDQAP